MLHRTVSVFHLQNLLMWEYRSKNYKICSSLTACKLVPFQRKVNHYTTMYTKFNHLSGNNGASSIKGSNVNSTLVLMNNCFDWIQHSRHFKLFNNLVPPSINMIKLICCTQLKKVNGKNTMWSCLTVCVMTKCTSAIPCTEVTCSEPEQLLQASIRILNRIYII